MRYGLEGRNSILESRKNFLFFLEPTSLLCNEYEVKRPGREDSHSPPHTAEVKKDGAVPPLPIRLHGVVLERAPSLFKNRNKIK